MKKFITTILEAVVIVAMIFGFTAVAFDAWDNTMTDDEILYYLNDDPSSKKLQKMALKRNLVYEDEIIEGKWIGGAPEFGPYDGHCDFSKASEFEKEDAILEFTSCLVDNTGCDWNVAYDIAKNAFSE